jgi:outer membrane immunogenic protein
MRRFLSAIVFVLAIAVAAPAFAADQPVPAPKSRKESAPRRTEPAQRTESQTAKSNWDGGQAGGSNGASSVNNNFVEPGAYVCPAAFPYNVSCFESPFAFRGHPVSYTVGPFLGYRWQFGNTVFGVEGDWSWKKAENTALVSLPFVCFDATCANYRSDTKSATIKQTWDSSLRLRYGWLVTPDTLVYGTAGVAIGQISGSFNFQGTLFTTVGVSPPFTVVAGSTATSAASWSDTRVGGTVGAGVETALWGRWKARLEYRYTDFGRYTKTVAVNTICVAPTGCSAPSSTATIDLRESFHTVRVGLGFDF